MAEKPNVVIMFMDDMGYADIAVRSPDYPTPNLDRMAKEGRKFTDFYLLKQSVRPHGRTADRVLQQSHRNCRFGSQIQHGSQSG